MKGNKEMSVAETILQQLGGHRFTVMTGSNHYLSDGYTLRMHLAKNHSKANRLEITLDEYDTYTMRFYKYTAGRLDRKTYTWTADKVEEVETFHGIYCDQLQEIFTQVTWMYTRL